MRSQSLESRPKRQGLVVMIFLVLVVGLVAVLFVQTGAKEEEQGGDSWVPSGRQLAEVTPVESRVYGEIEVDGKRLKVEVADTAAKQKTGLSYREDIAGGVEGVEGMLFVMPVSMRHSFWMKGMRFPLDIVWISCGEGLGARDSGLGQSVECLVVDVDEGVPPPEDPDKPKNFYSPAQAASHVLEVEAGVSEELGIGVGSEIVVQVLEG